LFDLELSVVLRMLTRQDTSQANQLWIYCL
jgi:hypothetical protein